MKTYKWAGRQKIGVKNFSFLIKTPWSFFESTIPYFLRKVQCKLITPAPEFNTSIRVHNELGMRSVTLFSMENSPVLHYRITDFPAKYTVFMVNSSWD